MDRCCGAQPLLLLILGGTPHAQPWLDAAASLKALPLQVCQIATAGGNATHSRHSGSGKLDVQPSQQSQPGLPTFVDATGQWQQVRGVPEGGAILVRPDGHVAWRSRGSDTVEHCTDELRTAIQRVMGL